MPLLKVVQCVSLSRGAREGRERTEMAVEGRQTQPSAELSHTIIHRERVCVCVWSCFLLCWFFVDQTLLMILSLGLVIRKLLHPDNTLKVNHMSFFYSH